MVSGDGGVGKSLLMQQLLTACASGGMWLERSVEHCPCVAVWCEDDGDELWRRQERINEAYRCAPDDLAGLTYIERCGDDSVLIDYGRWGKDENETPFFAQVRHVVMMTKAKILLLDTVADVFGGNENIRPQVRRFISILRRLAIEMQGCVILTSHPSMAGRASGTGESGSTAWQNSVRCRLYLTRDDKQDDACRVLKTMKLNQGPSGGMIPLVWREGVFQVSGGFSSPPACRSASDWP